MNLYGIVRVKDGKEQWVYLESNNPPVTYETDTVGNRFVNSFDPGVLTDFEYYAQMVLSKIPNAYLVVFELNEISRHKHGIR